MIDYIVLAFALGYVSYPIIAIIKFIFTNAWKATYGEKDDSKRNG